MVISDQRPTIASPGPELGLQAHFWAPPPPPDPPESTEDPGGSLVSTPHNSAEVKAPTCLKTKCTQARFVKGVCAEHGNVHWLLVPCKRRDCDTCGPVGRYRIAQRIALGVRELWPAAWMVLTFREDVTKEQAVRKLATFVKWIRMQPRTSKLEYVATYEYTAKGRIHINLIMAPWIPIRQRTLQAQWGARLWVEWVRSDQAVGSEAAGAYNPEALGGYLSKLEQAVPEGRRVSYSKGWPKLPKPPETDHEVKWTQLSIEEQVDVAQLNRLGWLEEIKPGHFRLVSKLRDIPPCECFESQLELPWPIPVSS